MISAVMPTYARVDVAFEKGEGAYLFDQDGRRYLDFGAGIAVISLGHCHPRIVEALREQAGKILAGNWKTPSVPELWDGKAAQRIVAILTTDLST